MQHISTDHVKQTLFASIDSLLSRRDEFLVNPQSSFTRVKKISFTQTILFPMVAGADNSSTELLDFFGEENLPTPSSMVQRRNQIKPEAFSELFYNFSKNIPIRNTFCGYQILAGDGSRLNLPFDPSNPLTFIQCIEGRKGINQLHMNSLYDPLNNIFTDIELQGIHDMNEKEAYTAFLDKYAHTGQKRIYIADRGYASYNIFAHCIHNEQLFLIRVPESFAKDICTTCPPCFDDPCVDVEVTVHIGRRDTKGHNKLENYHCIKSSGHYDFVEARTDGIDRLKIRIMKFPIGENSYEYVVTNLPSYSFSIQTIKKLYNLRWGEETAFRHLKYAGNIVHIHSLKNEFLLQEIYAKLTLYNFSSWLAASIEVTEKKTDKHTYVLNHTQLLKIAIRFIKGTVQEVKALITKYWVPIRPGRKFKRNIRRQSADTLTYR